MLLHIYECGCRGLAKDDAKAKYWRAKLAARP
jgi:TPR repeat protein